MQNSFFISYNQIEHSIRLDQTGYICLNDLIKYFPDKSLDDFIHLESTQKLIQIANKELEAKSNRAAKKTFYTIKDDSLEELYAHKYLALEFLSWLSFEFKILVVKKLEELYRKQFKAQANPRTNLKKFKKTWNQMYADEESSALPQDDDISNAVTKLAQAFTGKSQSFKEFEIRIQVSEKSTQITHQDAYEIYIIHYKETDEYIIERNPDFVVKKRGLHESALNTIHTLTLKSSQEAVRLEQFLHEKFYYKKIYNDWFKLDAKDLRFIEMLKVYIQDLG